MSKEREQKKALPAGRQGFGEKIKNIAVKGGIIAGLLYIVAALAL